MGKTQGSGDEPLSDEQIAADEALIARLQPIGEASVSDETGGE